MPKSAKQIAAAQQARQRALNAAIARAKTDLCLKRDYQVARLIGVNPQTFSHYVRDGFWGMSLDKYIKMAHALQFTREENDAIIGIPAKW